MISWNNTLKAPNTKHLMGDRHYCNSVSAIFNLFEENIAYLVRVLINTFSHALALVKNYQAGLEQAYLLKVRSLPRNNQIQAVISVFNEHNASPH